MHSPNATTRLRLHIENDPAAPPAMRVSAPQVRARLDDAGAAEAFDISENAEPVAIASCIAGAAVLLACRKLDLSARCLDIFVDNRVRFRSGAPLRNLVDPTLGY